jgi:antitoxin component YwqK of YwqJK toxin-antitoxin module
MMRNSLFLISTLILISSCESFREIDNKEIKVLYDNGDLYCSGSRKVYKKGLRRKENRIGKWNFYYPDNSLDSQTEYDNEGNIISRKLYSESGVIQYISTALISDETEVISELYYYDSGKLELEIITRYEVDGESEKEIETMKVYYLNGNIFEQIEYINNICINRKRWDKNNNLLLNLNYKKGLIDEESIEVNSE